MEVWSLSESYFFPFSQFVSVAANLQKNRLSFLKANILKTLTVYDDICYPCNAYKFIKAADKQNQQKWSIFNPLLFEKKINYNDTLNLLAHIVIFQRKQNFQWVNWFLMMIFYIKDKNTPWPYRGSNESRMTTQKIMVINSISHSYSFKFLKKCTGSMHNHHIPILIPVKTTLELFDFHNSQL
jgi:hypothetical protein